jgi:hypothetical protein
MSHTDSYAEWDAAYVLGALTGAERAEYEDHLAGCRRCRDAVAELAGMPGLLGQLTPAEAMAVDLGSSGSSSLSLPVAEEHDVPPPASLMPVLPLPLPRRRWLAPVAAAAAALLIGGVGGYAVSEAQGARPGGAATALGSTRLAFVPVEASPMTAVVDVVPTAAGTELRVECQYAQLTAGGGSATSTGTVGTGADQVYGDALHYAIWVVGKDGRDAQVKDWTARSGLVMHPSGITALRRDAIAAVEIRQVDTGGTVMRAQVG